MPKCRQRDRSRIRKRKRTEENAVHQAEDGGIRADTERERNDGDGGEAFVLQQHAESVADVVQGGCHSQFTWVTAIMGSVRFINSFPFAVPPPSTSRLCPVTKDDLPEHNQRTASATSSARPSRPIGWNWTRSSFFIRNPSASRSTISVSITAGFTALMRIPCAEYSMAPTFVSPMTACFEAM